MRYLYRFNQFIEKWMPFVTPICLTIGILSASYLSKLAFMVPWAFAFMTFTGSLGSGFRDMKKIVTDPIPLFVVLFILHVWMPMIAFGVGNLFFPGSPYFITGIVLAFVVPTGIVSLVWVSIYKGNSILTISIILLDTFLAPILIPLSLKLLVGTTVEINALGMVKDLIFMIAIPAVLAMGLNEYTKGEIKKTWSPKLAPFSKIGLVMVVSINSTKVAPFFKELNPVLFAIAGTILLIASTGYVWGWIASRILKKEYSTTISMTINSGMRNISAGAVLAAQYFPGEVMFPVMIGTVFQQILVSIAAHTLSRAERKRNT
jgi:predicted Na+-dependent transporter